MSAIEHEPLSKEAHQAMAMQAAFAIRSLYSPSAKEKARKEVFHHLRASLRPVAAERV